MCAAQATLVTVRSRPDVVPVRTSSKSGRRSPARHGDNATAPNDIAQHQPARARRTAGNNAHIGPEYKMRRTLRAKSIAANADTRRCHPAKDTQEVRSRSPQANTQALCPKTCRSRAQCPSRGRAKCHAADVRIFAVARHIAPRFLLTRMFAELTIPSACLMF